MRRRGLLGFLGIITQCPGVGRAQAPAMPVTGLLNERRDQIIALAARMGLSAIYPLRQYAPVGGIMPAELDLKTAKALGPTVSPWLLTAANGTIE